MATTDTAAALSSPLRYDGYGQTQSSWTASGPLPSPWRYQGRLELSPDAANPLYENGARSYAPGLGAFTQLDSYAGSVQAPLSMNRYLYAEANPATLIDPTGHRPIEGDNPWDGGFTRPAAGGQPPVVVVSSPPPPPAKVIESVTAPLVSSLQTPNSAEARTIGGGWTPSTDWWTEYIDCWPPIACLIEIEEAPPAAMPDGTVIQGGYPIAWLPAGGLLLSSTIEIATSVDELVAGGVVRTSTARLLQVDRTGGLAQATRDLERLAVNERTTIALTTSREGEAIAYMSLQEGGTVSMRTFSSGGEITIQINLTSSRQVIKLRYGPK